MSKTISADDLELERRNDGYEDLLECIRRSFDNAVKEGEEPLFTTDASGLFDLFLSNLPGEARQHYNCRACRNFIDRFGGLVRIDRKGTIHPAMWTYAPPGIFTIPLEEIRERVKRAKVTGVFVPDSVNLGIKQTGHWTHMAVEAPKAMIPTDRLRTAYQIAAGKAEDFKMLEAAVKKYDIQTIETAVNLLRSNSLYRSEKVLGIAEWFLVVLQESKGKRKQQNILWKKVATAPTGFCHVSSSMIGTLADDIGAG